MDEATVQTQAENAANATNAAQANEASKNAKEKENENVLLREQIKTLTETILKLQKNLELESKARQEAIEKLQQDKINAVITEAIQKGKIPPEKAEAWKKKLQANFDEFIEVINELPEKIYTQKEKEKESPVSVTKKELSHKELEKQAIELMNNKLSQTIN